MARLVPKKIEALEDREQDLTMHLKRSLSDSALVLQNTPCNGAYMVMEPSKRPFFVVPFWGVTEVSIPSQTVKTGDGDVSLGDFLTSADAKIVQHQIEECDLFILCEPSGEMSSEVFQINENSNFHVVVEPEFAAVESTIMDVDAVNSILLECFPDEQPVEDKPVEKTGFFNLSSATKTDVVPQADPFPASTSSDFPLPSGPTLLPTKRRPIAFRSSTGQFQTNKSSSNRVKFAEAMVDSMLDMYSNNYPIFVAGLMVPSDFIGKRDYFLPAMLIAASDKWSPVASYFKGESGFDIRLSRDPEALTGFIVKDVLVSSPLLFTCALKEVIKSAVKPDKGEVDFSGVQNMIEDFVARYDIDGLEMEQLDMRVAMATLEDD